jgi:hypothetical protein
VLSPGSRLAGSADKRIGLYPLWRLIAITALAHLADAAKGLKVLAKFAKGLSQVQMRVLDVLQQPIG